MKKFLLTAAMGVMFFIGLTSMATMNSADPYPDCQEDCAFLVGIGAYPTHGACMSACHTCTSPANNVTPNYAVCICKIIQAEFGLQNAGFKNFGECVTTLKSEDPG